MESGASNGPRADIFAALVVRCKTQVERYLTLTDPRDPHKPNYLNPLRDGLDEQLALRFPDLADLERVNGDGWAALLPARAAVSNDDGMTRYTREWKGAKVVLEFMSGRGVAENPVGTVTTVMEGIGYRAAELRRCDMPNTTICASADYDDDKGGGRDFVFIHGDRLYHYTVQRLSPQSAQRLLYFSEPAKLVRVTP